MTASTPVTETEDIPIVKVHKPKALPTGPEPVPEIVINVPEKVYVKCRNTTV